MADFPQVGVEFVTKFFDDYERNMQKGEALAQGFGTKALTAATGAVALGNVLANVATIAGGAFVNGLTMAGNAAYGIGATAVQVAGRVQQLEVILATAGDRAGITQTKLEGLREGIEDAGISSRVALQSLTLLIRNQLDYTKAVELATAAQNLATVADTDSSATLERLVLAVTRLDPLMARTAGSMVTAEEAATAYAEANDKAANSLTMAERQQAFMNAVIEDAAALEGAYDASMTTANKQLGSQTRLVETLFQKIGDHLLPAYTAIIFGQNEWLKTMTSAVSEGGQLYHTMSSLGAVISVVAEQIMSGMNLATKAILDWIGKSDEEIGDFILDAFTWGAEFVANFALGIIQGASTVIATAMSYIASLLAFFLAPGSPPRVAPMLPEWGAAAFTEYLKGFSDADFSILESVQGPMQKALQRLVTLGQISQQKAADLFTGLSERIAADLAKNGEVAESTLQALSRSLGRHGAQIANLVRLNSDYANAVTAVKTATEELTAAQQKIAEQQQRVAQLVAQYNELRRSGATDEELKAKREQILAAQSGLIDAREQADIAAEDKAVAEEKATSLKEQVSLQDRLVKQLQTIADMQATAAKAALETGGGAAMGVSVATPDPEALGEEIAARIDYAVRLAKAKIQIRLNNLKREIQEKWDDVIAPKIETIQQKWDEIAETVSTFWNDKIQPILDLMFGEDSVLSGFFDNLVKWGGILAGVVLAFSLFASIAAVLLGVVLLLLNPFALLFIAFVGLVTIWENVKENIIGFAKTVGEKVDEVINKFKEVPEKVRTFLVEDLPGKLLEAKDTVKEKAEEFFKEAGKSVVKGLEKGISDNWDRFVGWVVEQLGKVKDAIFSFFGINTPSRLMMGVGEALMEGLGKGVIDNANMAVGAMNAAMNATMQPVQHVVHSAPQSGGDTIYNMNWNASYAETQSPVQIRDDTAALISLAKMTG